MQPSSSAWAWWSKASSRKRRSDLGDHDKDRWEVDNEGQPRDPWQFTNYLILHDAESGEVYTFATASKGGLGAIGELCKAYGKAMRQKPDQYPVIELDVGSYQHRDRSLGRIKFPIFKIVGWIAKDGGQRSRRYPSRRNRQRPTKRWQPSRRRPSRRRKPLPHSRNSKGAS